MTHRQPHRHTHRHTHTLPQSWVLGTSVCGIRRGPPSRSSVSGTSVSDIRLRDVRPRQMAQMDVPQMESQDGGPTHFDVPSEGHSLCQSALVVRLEDFRLDPPSRGHPSGSSVSGISVWILRLWDIRLDPPSQRHPSGSSVLGASVWNLRLGDIRLGLQITPTEVSLIITHRAI